MEKACPDQQLTNCVRHILNTCYWLSYFACTRFYAFFKINYQPFQNLKTFLNFSSSDSLPSISVVIFICTSMTLQLNSPISFTPDLIQQLYHHLSGTRVISWRFSIASEGESGSNSTIHTSALWVRIYLSENLPQKCTQIRCLCRSILNL